MKNQVGKGGVYTSTKKNKRLLKNNKFISFEWIRVSSNSNCYFDLMNLGNFYLIKDTIYDNITGIDISSTIMRVELCDLSDSLFELIKKPKDELKEGK